MSQKMKDVVNILIAVVIAAAMTVWGLWLSGQPMIHHLSDLGIAFHARISLWVLFIPTFACIGTLWRLRLMAKRLTKLQADSIALSAQVTELTNTEPKLHAVWISTQVRWSMAYQGITPMMHLAGWLNLSSSNTNETLILLSVQVDGKASTLPIHIRVEPGYAKRESLSAYLLPPLESDQTKDYVAQITVEDHKNRRYTLPVCTFQHPLVPLSPPSDQSNESGMY